MSLANAFASRRGGARRGRGASAHRTAAAALNPHAAANSMLTSSAVSLSHQGDVDALTPQAHDDDQLMYERFVLGGAGSSPDRSTGGIGSPGGRLGKRKTSGLLGDDDGLGGVGGVGAGVGGKKQKRGGSAGGGMFGDDDGLPTAGMDDFGSSLHDAFALTTPVGGEEHGDGSVGTRGRNGGVGDDGAGGILGGAGGAGVPLDGHSSLSIGDYNIPLGDIGTYGSSIDELQFAHFLQSGAVDTPPPPAESTLPNVELPEAQAPHQPEADLTVDSAPLPSLDVSVSDPANLPPLPTTSSAPPLPALDLDAIDPSLKDIAASALADPGQHSLNGDISRRTSDPELEEIQQLLGYHSSAYGLPGVASASASPIVEDISTDPSASTSGSIPVSAPSDAHSLSVHDLPINSAHSASSRAGSAVPSISATPAPPPTKPKKLTKKQREAAAAAAAAAAANGEEGYEITYTATGKKITPRPAGGSRHHTPVINLQAPTPRNPNGTAPGASDFAPPSGGPTARQAAEGFAGDEENPHPCPLPDCDKKFARKSDFLRHYRIHTGERPFVCEIDNCGKSFIQRSALTVHQRVHSGEKPHACQDCGRLFSDSSSLARHRRIHAGLKPFACEMCGTKSFSRKATLTRHQNICASRPPGYIPQPEEPIVPRKKKPSKSKSKAAAGTTTKKGKKGAAAAAAADSGAGLDLTNHAMYQLNGMYPATASGHSTPGTGTSFSASPEPDVQVGDVGTSHAAHFDLSSFGALPPYPGVNLDPATGALLNFRNSPSAAFLNLGAGDTPSPGSLASPRLAQQHRRLSGRIGGEATLPMSPQISTTRSTVQPAAAPKRAAAPKKKGKAAKGKSRAKTSKGKGKAAAAAAAVAAAAAIEEEEEEEEDAPMQDLNVDATGLGLQLGDSIGGGSLPPLPPLPSDFNAASFPALPRIPPPSQHHEDSDECGSECDGECGRDKSDIERERAAAVAALAGQHHEEEEDEEDEEGSEEEDDEDDEGSDDEGAYEVPEEQAAAVAALVHGFGVPGIPTDVPV
ncbi:hypothetical protein JCM8097_006077 [Rhodosporidiobolus ruineniae]